MPSLYGLIDAARDERLHPWLAAAPDCRCLFGGKLDPIVEKVSPFIVRLPDGAPLLDAWRSEGWGHAWGIQCISGLELLDLRRHFRQFLQATLPDGKTVLFRFYDPRVWRIYLPTCNMWQLEKWFAGVVEYRSEDEAGESTLHYWLDAGRLRVSKEATR